MPTYAYHCDNCGVEFERFQKFSEKPLTRCPECKGKVRRVPQVSAVVFKGAGWYVNDSRKTSSASSTGKTESKPDSAAASSESATSDSQPESKPDSKPKATSKPADD